MYIILRINFNGKLVQGSFAKTIWDKHRSLCCLTQTQMVFECIFITPKHNSQMIKASNTRFYTILQNKLVKVAKEMDLELWLLKSTSNIYYIGRGLFLKSVVCAKIHTVHSEYYNIACVSLCNLIYHSLFSHTYSNNTYSSGHVGNTF